MGGMPEVINHYAKFKDITALAEIFNSLLTSYSDDVEKYADSTNQIQLIDKVLILHLKKLVNG